MHPDVHRYLDGELSRDALGPELAREVEEWEARFGAPAELAPPAAAPPWLEARVMAALPAHAPESSARRLMSWLFQPRPLRLRPITALAGAAALLLAVWVGSGLVRPATVATVASTAAPVPATDRNPASTPPVVYVQFSLVAPGARSVEVAGDFNGWQPVRAQLRDPEGDGTWTGMIPVSTGVHKYMFVIDGRRWVTDPRAHRFVDDGFGMKNSLIAVAAPARSS